MAKMKGLGKGLDALLGDEFTNEPEVKSSLFLPISQVESCAAQPRKQFDPDALADLADSIRQHGIIQPLTVRKLQSGYYQIIAGERRWRASQLAGLKAIPAYIRTIKDESIMEMALVENIQREDLNPIEIALAYEHLLESPGMTQERVSERVGKSRVAITNYLRLLKLPAQVQMALQKKEIDMGHARALLGLEDPHMQLKLFNEIVKNQYSVRKVEEMVKLLNNGDTIQSGKRKIQARSQLSEEMTQMRRRLGGYFNAKVLVACSPKGKGKITIPFNSDEDLQRIMGIFDQLGRKEDSSAPIGGGQEPSPNDGNV